MTKEIAASLDAHGIELIEKLATEAVKPEILLIDTAGLGGGLPAVVPVGFDRKAQAFKSLKDKIEEYRIGPARRQGVAKADTLKAFIDLVNRHKDSHSVLFGKTSWPQPKLTAVIDYHIGAADAADRVGAHRVDYAFPLTDEFKAWVNGDKKQFDQVEFAAYLEEHAAELAEADTLEKQMYEGLFREAFASPTELISLSRQLEVHVTSSAKQGVRLSSGERTIEFSEQHQGVNGEPVVIPGIFMVSVPAFVDGALVRIPARLRYRVSGQSVKWFYQLYRWESFLRDAVEAALAKAGDETALPTFDGAPEA
ncbi:MAG: hypothetical protein JWM58_557 [Rhizobium sp.]|nr:hypothetical protein [Rhizobium sp.]